MVSQNAHLKFNSDSTESVNSLLLSLSSNPPVMIAGYKVYGTEKHARSTKKDSADALAYRLEGNAELTFCSSGAGVDVKIQVSAWSEFGVNQAICDLTAGTKVLLDRSGFVIISEGNKSR